ncbi:MAG: HAMP domain-containing histidine kinase, partial [Clostridia bacterium]|nr:HAMP domain-containing histidine kinase [Clostridia bacterium]
VRILNERNLSIEKQLNQIKTEKELVVKTQNSKDEFIANVTHEMNTPLTAIKGYSELLASGMLNEEQTALAYKTIVGQSERLSNLIARIINYNELSNDDLPSYEIDLSKSVKETLNVLRVEAELRQITFIENISEGVKVFSRQERVNEVVGNLIRNAVRYNKDGGTVTITLTNNTLSVKDTGVGIAKENLDKIFSRFFTVDKSHSGKYGGFGLGLAVVKKICNISGWEIQVYSKLLEGSEFIVKFK